MAYLINNPQYSLSGFGALTKEEKAEKTAQKEAEKLIKAQVKAEKKAKKEAEKLAKAQAKAQAKAEAKAYKELLKTLKVPPPSPVPYVAPGYEQPLYQVTDPAIKLKKIPEPTVQYVYPEYMPPDETIDQQLASSTDISSIMAAFPTWGWVALAGMAVFLFMGKGLKGDKNVHDKRRK